MGDHPRSRRGSTFDAETLRGQRVDRNGTIHPPDDERQVLVDHLRGEQVDALAALLRTVDPSLTIVMGGPEMADHEDLPGAAAHAHYLISGQADRAFAGLCGALLAGRLEHPNVVRPGSGFARRSRPRATIPRRSRACSAQENSRFATRCSA